MPNHDWGYFLDPVTGCCGYCGDIHDVEVIPPVQVYDQATGAWLPEGAGVVVVGVAA